eukprot:TRINITY_DN25962_c0_g1_i2.p1 TRINITY_DN25962_c0_g1~~TRINITY_DN25962_c0_g1_i2.p1  ORF type:complete len:110 (-),score=32.61 TRINITY_DN25962_c0_g1_i2:12-341(-)
MAIDLNGEEYKAINPEIKALSLDKIGKHLLVGTIGSEIYELSIEPSSKEVEHWRCLVKGHSLNRKTLSTNLTDLAVTSAQFAIVSELSLIHICRCRRLLTCRSRWSPYH